MTTNTRDLLRTIALFVAIMVAGLALYLFIERPGKIACEKSGGEVISTGKNSWTCEAPLKVIIKGILPAEQF